MNKKFNFATIMLATSLIFAGCGNTQPANTTPAEEPAVVEEQVEETTDETTDKVVEETTDTVDEAAEETEEATEDPAETEEETTEEDTAAETPSAEGNIALHRAYPAEAGRSLANIVVATSGDKIVDVIIDEFQYYDIDSDYKGVPNSDGIFGEGAAEGKILGSKVDNNEAYSADMKEAGGEITLLDNYNAITDFASGKTIAELEEFLNTTEDEEVLDAVSGATFKATPNLLQQIVDTAKDDSFVSYGNATDPDAIELRYAIGAPHGDRGFGSAVVAVEGDTIVAANIDEFQYMEGGKTAQTGDAQFAEGYADSNVVLVSKLENNEEYSAMMAEKAGSTVTLAESYKAIEEFAAGKTIEELKAFVTENDPEAVVDAVTGATLVDTSGYLQLIIVAAESNIRIK